MLEILIIIIIILINLNYYLIRIYIFLISYIYIFNLNWIDWRYLIFNFRFNYYSLGLLILTLWIRRLILLNLKYEYYLNKILNIIIILFIIINFLSINLLIYYFLFEIRLLIIFIIIINWRLRFDRILSRFYLIFYTIIFSLPNLIILFILININKSLDFIIIEFNNFKLNNIIVIYLIIIFLVKIPIYLFHSWLLKAHVEAPFYSSIILASIILKLGGYGLIRLLFIFKYIFNFIYYFIILIIIGILILRLICIIQIDIKILVAISSIVHIILILMGLFFYTKIGFIGRYLIIISHGFRSSGLFYLINIIYINTNSRLLLINKGIIIYIPSISLIWFLLCSLNMAIPITLNLIREIILFMRIINLIIYIILPLIIYCLLRFLYSLYLFSYIQHGISLNLKNIFRRNLFNFFILIIHWIPINLLILNLNFLI